ncbi:hypothetical protein GGR54DRAFT_109132 [Hypoxylon sp. NC1633]|nr:hypothetical protein GGR54DRAFT_109132 [Hypoxylon sp. NC1633]
MASVWRRACAACTKAKRQCTKGVPACRRCVDKGIQCAYPPTRRHAPLVEAETAGITPSSSSSPGTIEGFENPPPVTHDSNNSSGNNDSTADVGAGGLDFPPLQLSQSGPVGADTADPQPSFDRNREAAAFAAAASAETWFLTPESFDADHTLPPSQPESIQEQIHQRFISGIQRWLRQWVASGSSPLHHRALYREEMPRVVQDAYTGVAAYDAAEAGAGAHAARVLDDRVTQLLQDQALEASLMSAGGREPRLFDHICRVQALLTYQTIRLFDGDVRMRAQAEALIPTLFLWIRELLQSARRNLAYPARFLASFADSSGLGPSPGLGPTLGSGSDGSGSGSASVGEDAVWRAWILVESARRTWLVANYVQEIYLYMKQGWGECPGRVTITMRAGLWDATSSYAWSRACRERGALFLPTRLTESVFYNTRPEDVDEFSLFIVEMSYGVERMERWYGESGCHCKEVPSLPRARDGGRGSARMASG